MTNLDSVLKSRDIALLTEVLLLVKVMVLPVVMYRCESRTRRKAEHQIQMLLKYGAGEDSGEFLGGQGEQTSQSERKLTLNIHWKD